MLINIIITKIRQVGKVIIGKVEVISSDGAELMNEGRSKSLRPKNSSFVNKPKGNISMVHFLQNQETSSDSFSSSLYSAADMSLHFM